MAVRRCQQPAAVPVAHTRPPVRDARTKRYAVERCRCRRWRGPGALLAALLATGCATSAERFEIVDRTLASEGPQAALARVESHPAAIDNSALGLLEKGMLLHLTGDHEGSNARLAEAAERMDMLEPFSVTEGLAAVTISENLREYVGQPHERVLLHVIRAFNFMARQRWDEARVEARQIDLRLNALAQAPFYRDDPFARYVAGLIHEELGERDDARIAYRKAWQAYRDQHEATGVDVPRPLQQALLRVTDDPVFADEHAELRALFASPTADANNGTGTATRAQTGRIVLILGDGRAPRMREVAINAQHPRTGRLHRIAVPAYGRSRKALHGASLHANGQSTDAAVVHDIDALARQSLDARMPGIMARAVVRVAAKNRMVSEAGDEDPLLGFLVNIFTFASERADDRAWTTLPGGYRLAEIALAPGPHEVELELHGRGGASWRENLGTVDVTAGRTQFLFAHSLSARVPFQLTSGDQREH